MFYICAGFSRRLDELENAQIDRNFWDAMSGKQTNTTNSTTETNDQNT
jgi:hypothetical protein